jgi:hypothetical protein
MLKILKNNLFWLFYFAFWVAIAFQIFLGWVLMISVLFGFFLLFRFTGLEARLSQSEQRLYLTTMLLYPAIETVVQWVGSKGWVGSYWVIVNRLEHACWATFLALLFLPVFSEFWRALNGWQNLLFVLGFVCLLGNLNEFLEYYARLEPGFVILPETSARYCTDTILDMAMNLLGGGVGFVILQQIKRPQDTLS